MECPTILDMATGNKARTRRTPVLIAGGGAAGCSGRAGAAGTGGSPGEMTFRGSAEAREGQANV